MPEALLIANVFVSLINSRSVCVLMSVFFLCLFACQVTYKKDLHAVEGVLRGMFVRREHVCELSKLIILHW